MQASRQILKTIKTAKEKAAKEIEWILGEDIIDTDIDIPSGKIIKVSGWSVVFISKERKKKRIAIKSLPIPILSMLLTKINELK
jgi:hypothetical protein